jgi:ubiquinone/menaquinone biosynthesis C-methylase UbiE
MTILDWGLGKFELIAPQLLPAAHAAVELADVRQGAHVVDVGCGSGNAALLAARPGVLVTGVDPAPRLLDVARGRATAQGLDIDFVAGDAAAIPLPDGSADVVMSVFGVIFAPDPAAAAAEMARITAPTGQIVLTAWLRGGFLELFGEVLMSAVVRATGFQPPQPFAWHDRDTVAALVQPHGFEVVMHERELTFTAKSVEDYWQTQVIDHPISTLHTPVLQQHGLFEEAKEQALSVLAASNEDSSAFRASAPYVVITAQR